MSLALLDWSGGVEDLGNGKNLIKYDKNIF